MGKPPYTIKTSRLGLRPWHSADLAPYATMNTDPAVMHYFPQPLSMQQSRESMERQTERFLEHGFCFWATDFLETGEFLGFIGLSMPGFEAHFTPCLEIGWRLKQEFWGRGLATEGALACLEYAARTLDAKEIYSFTPVANKQSERVMQKIGMHRIGTFMHPLVPKDHALQEHSLYRIKIN